MRVTVQFHEAAEADLTRWIRSLGRTRGERAGFAAVYLEDIETQLRLHRGRPPGAIQLSQWVESAWTWEYQAGRTWLLYQLRPGRSLWDRILGRKSLRVLILRVVSRPPTTEDLAGLAFAFRPPR